MCPLVSKLTHIMELVKTLECYDKDPKQVLVDLRKSDIAKNGIINDERIINIQTGLSSEVTHAYAVATGRKLIVDVLKKLVDELEQGLNKRYGDIANFGAIIDNSLKPIEELMLSDAMETRWLSVNSDEMYQKYFLQRLERDFLQMVNSTNWGVNFVLTMEKFIIIYRYFINRALEKDMVSEISTANDAMKDILDLTKKIDSVEMIVPSDMMEKFKVPTEVPEFKYFVPILSQQDTGKLLKDIATEAPDINNTGNVVVLPALQDLQKRLDKLYQKLEGDIHAFKNILETGYPVYLKDILAIAKAEFVKVITDYESVMTTDEVYERKTKSIINLFIRLIEMDRQVTDTANVTANNLSKLTSNFLALFQLYNIMLAYSLNIKTINAKIGPNR